VAALRKSGVHVAGNLRDLTEAAQRALAKVVAVTN
jgi:hypothetical protein